MNKSQQKLKEEFYEIPSISENINYEMADSIFQWFIDNAYRLSDKADTVTDKLLGTYNAWSLRDVLITLIKASDILLHKKNYDGNDHEEILTCLNKANVMVDVLSSREVTSFKLSDKAKTVSDEELNRIFDGQISQIQSIGPHTIESIKLKSDLVKPTHWQPIVLPLPPGAIFQRERSSNG